MKIAVCLTTLYHPLYFSLPLKFIMKLGESFVQVAVVKYPALLPPSVEIPVDFTPIPYCKIQPVLRTYRVNPAYLLSGGELSSLFLSLLSYNTRKLSLGY